MSNSLTGRVQGKVTGQPVPEARPARAVSSRREGGRSLASFSQTLATAKRARTADPPTSVAAVSLASLKQGPPAGLASLRRRLSGPLQGYREPPARRDNAPDATTRRANGSPGGIEPAGVGTTGAAAATRAGDGRLAAGSRPLALADYPRPTGDNGRGLHWVPTLGSSQEVVDRFVGEAVEMKAKWVVFLNEDTKVGANDYLVKQLVGHGIMPILRIYTPNGAPIQGDVKALVRHYRALGVRYYQIYNEPNLRVENGGAAPDPKRFVDHWLPAAKAIAEAGGLPGLAPLAPGGDYDDLAFLREALETIKARGETAVFDRAWIGLHNYTLNHPIDYTKDSNGFLKFRWYDRIVRQQLGRSLPIVGTEGGTWIGQHEDKTLPPVNEGRQVELAVEAYQYMRRAEPYYFAYTYWVLANELGGGTDPAWRDHALFRPDRTSPVVSALKALA